MTDQPMLSEDAYAVELRTKTRHTPLTLLDWASDVIAHNQGIGLRASLDLAGVPDDAHQAVLSICHEALDYSRWDQ